MVRLRIHTEQDDTSTQSLQLKSNNKSLLTLQSPTHSRLESASPRKQRVLKKIQNNAVLLGDTGSFGIVKPSKFLKSPVKAQALETEESVLLEKTEDVSPQPQIRLREIKATRRRRIVESDSESETECESDASIADIIADKLILEPVSIQLSGDDDSSNVHKKLAEDLSAALERQGFGFQTSPQTASETKVVDNLCSSRPTTASGLGAGALLSFEPSRLRSPVKLAPERPCTPPAELSPGKVKLRSPTKKFRLPESPHKPSSDEFWCPSVVNDWIDQYSPQKPIKSPSKYRFQSLSTEEVDAIPFSPLRPTSSSSSPTKAQKQAKKHFDAIKHQLATDFLAELDCKITHGQIATLAASTGGVSLVWSNKLNSTAGRAHWRKTQTRTKHTDGTVSVVAEHHASIELSTKVLDDETRLINTIAHEFCHLATFMIDGVKTNPHGKEFKKWASLCSSAANFAQRGVKVTTKHSYEIDYKYVWCCGACGQEYKRHSKSVDTARHRCGACKGVLVQVKPVPRRTQRTAASSAGPSEYQTFIKENFQRVKADNAGAGLGAVMQILARMYREQKASTSAEPQQQQQQQHTDEDKKEPLDDLVNELEAIELSD